MILELAGTFRRESQHRGVVGGIRDWVIQENQDLSKDAGWGYDESVSRLDGVSCEMVRFTSSKIFSMLASKIFKGWT